MKKTVIIYHSKTGTTRNYSEAIGGYLNSKSNEVIVVSIEEYKSEILRNANFLFLGCWTSGLMFFLQHPEKKWMDFAAKLPDPIKPRIALFTTYKFLTGSMFKKMTPHLNENVSRPFFTFKSRNGLLSERDKTALDQFISQKQ